jgi:hypothetical protein
MIVWHELKDINVIPRTGEWVLVGQYRKLSIGSFKKCLCVDLVRFDTNDSYYPEDKDLSSPRYELYMDEEQRKDTQQYQVGYDNPRQVNYAENILDMFTHYAYINNPDEGNSKCRKCGEYMFVP